MIKKQWYQLPAKKTGENNEELARRCAEQAASRETNQVQLRWRNLVFFRHLTGRRDAYNFYFGMAKRPSALFAYYGTVEFEAPRDNVLAECRDVYINRLFKSRTFVSVLPERGNFKQRLQSKGLEQWGDACLDEIGFWDEYPKLGNDAAETGTGWLKFSDDGNGEIDLTRPHTDCMLFANPDDDDWRDEVIERMWVSRTALLEEYEDDEDAVKAIEEAPGAWPAFWFGSGTLDNSDVIPLLDCWKAKRGKKMGRHVRCINGYVFCDEEYDGPTIPYEKWEWDVMSSGVFGQGLVEQGLSLQDELDMYMSGVSESHARVSWQKWLVEVNSGVNTRALGDTPGAIVTYQAPHKPEPIISEAATAETYGYIDHLKQAIKERLHVNNMAVQGEIPAGLKSGTAIEKYDQVEDKTFAEKGGRLEQFVIKCFYQLIRLGAKLKPSYKLQGRDVELVKWDSAWSAEKKPIGLTAFGVSRLPQTVAGRQQFLDNLLANGAISRTTWSRYSQIPDVDGLQDILNAPQESIDRQLDDLLEGNYTPPTPFGDLAYALKQVEARYCYESNWGTPQNVLDLFLQYRAAVKEMLAEQATPDGMPAPGAVPAPPPQPAQLTAGAPAPPQGFGDQIEGNPALAPAPPQIPATMGPVGPTN